VNFATIATYIFAFKHLLRCLTGNVESNKFYVWQVSYFKHSFMTNYHHVLREYQVSEME